MRTTLRQLLVAGVPEIGERWYQDQAVPLDPTRQVFPFGVLRAGQETPGEAWGGLSVPMEAWPYAKPNDFVTVDALVAKIQATLDNATFTEAGKRYLIGYAVPAGQDFYDSSWKAITRPVRFRVYDLSWFSGSTDAPDPALALRAWTAAQWPGQIQTDPATWTPSDGTPALYWRVLRQTMPDPGPGRGQTAWGAWIHTILRGHVLAATHGVRVTWLRRITERLMTTRRIAFGDGRQMLVPAPGGAIEADSEADPMGAGQIALTVAYGVHRQAPSPAPEILMNAPVELEVAQSGLGA